MPPNPVRLKKQWFRIEPRTGHISPGQLSVFYAAVCSLKNTIQRDYLLLLLFTGLRRREASGLRWSDIDFVEQVIRLPGARTKSGARLDLPMTDIVRDLLVARRALGDAAWVFPSISISGHLEEPKFAFDLLRDACGISASAHDLRRTFITVASGTSITGRSLMALVNHSLGSGVTAGYDQMTVTDLREPAQRVADRMKELCDITSPENEQVTLLRSKRV